MSEKENAITILDLLASLNILKESASTKPDKIGWALKALCNQLTAKILWIHNFYKIPPENLRAVKDSSRFDKKDPFKEIKESKSFQIWTMEQHIYLNLGRSPFILTLTEPELRKIFYACLSELESVGFKKIQPLVEERFFVFTFF